MIDRYFVFGVASLQIIPVFTLTYLEHELTILANIFHKIPSKLLSILAMLLSFGLMFSQTFSTEDTLRIVCSILFIVTLSLGIHYTYDVYTVDEGYYVTIPYLSIYSCLVFLIATNEYPLYTLESYRLSIVLLSTFVCYLLFSISVYFDLGFSTSYLNYIAFIGVLLTTFNLIFLINQSKQTKSVIEHLVFQFIHLYLYFAHLLSVQLEFNTSSQISHPFHKH